MGWSRRDLLLGGGALGAYAAIKVGSRGGLTAGRSDTPADAENSEQPEFNSSPTETETPIEPPTISVTLDHERAHPMELQISLDIDPSPGTETLSAGFSDTERLVSTDGFSAPDREMNGYEWDGESESCSMELVIDTADEESETFGGQDYAGTKSWLFAPTPSIWIDYSDGSDAGVGSFLGDRIDVIGDHDQSNVMLNLESPGFVGETSIFLGSYEDHLFLPDGPHESFQLIVPSHAELADTRGVIFEALEFASTKLSVGAQYDTFLVFVATDPVRRGGLQMGSLSATREEAWVHESSRVDDPDSTWLHEYVHTRQSYSLAADMEWFTEASAEYYAARLWWEKIRSETNTTKKPLKPWNTAIDAVRHLRPGSEYVSDDLTDEDTWTDGRTPYRKGGYVLLALDELIRDESGSATLQTLFWRLNMADETVDYEQFIEIVSELAGLSQTKIQLWGSLHIAGATLPEPRGWWGEVAAYVEGNPIDLGPIRTET